MKCVNKATQSLWTQTGATLEHVVLWWCNTPLACQPVAAARHLREWLLNMQYDGKYFPKIFITIYVDTKKKRVFYCQKMPFFYRGS